MSSMGKGRLKALIYIFLLLLLLLLNNNHVKCSVVQAMIIESPTPQPAAAPLHGITPGSLHPQECSPRCTNRCSRTAFKKPCMFFCQKCCETCLCVPPGTYGNKEFCPCYNNWKTKRGGPKCP